MGGLFPSEVRRLRPVNRIRFHCGPHLLDHLILVQEPHRAALEIEAAHRISRLVVAKFGASRSEMHVQITLVHECLSIVQISDPGITILFMDVHFHSRFLLKWCHNGTSTKICNRPRHPLSATAAKMSSNVGK